MREFDASLQRLGKLLYTFFQEEGVRSISEKEALVRVCIDNICKETLMQESIAASKESIKRDQENAKTS